MARWTASSLRILKKFYSSKGAKYVAGRTGHPVSSVVIKANTLGIRSGAFKRWKQMEVNYLLNNYPVKSIYSIARTLRRSPASVDGKARQLKIYVPPQPKWTEADLEQLRKLWTDRKFSVEEIAVKLNKTKSSVHAQAWGMGMRRPQVWRFWTKDEENYLKKNYNKKTSDEIAAGLAMTKSAVHHKASRLGLKLKRTPRPWTKADDDYIKLNYRIIPTRIIAVKLDRIPNSVIDRAVKLGVSHKDIETKGI